MQDPSSSFPQFTKPNFTFPEQEQLKCPRCDSANTKFCYYNNYNLSQPRYFCKSCRRYWTKGGALRNIPVGGGTRKNSSSKRSSSSSTTATTSAGGGGSSSSSDTGVDPPLNPNSKRPATTANTTRTPELDPDQNQNQNPTQNHNLNPNNLQQPQSQSPVLLGLGTSVISGLPLDQHHPRQMVMDTTTTGGFISLFGSPTTTSVHQPQQQQISNLTFLQGLAGGPVIPSARIVNLDGVSRGGYNQIPAGFNHLRGGLNLESTVIRDGNTNSHQQELRTTGDSSEGFYQSFQQFQQNGWPGGGGGRLTINTATPPPPPPHPGSSRATQQQ